MRRIFGLKGKQVKKVLQGKAHCLDWQNNITIVLSQTERWDGHVTRTEERTNSYWILKDFKDRDSVK
jgi:hypothetical protein